MFTLEELIQMSETHTHTHSDAHIRSMHMVLSLFMWMVTEMTTWSEQLYVLGQVEHLHVSNRELISSTAAVVLLRY